jgi:hypothetical protein
MKTGIYIHIPFCRTKCDYCSFYSIPVKDNIITRANPRSPAPEGGFYGAVAPCPTFKKVSKKTKLLQDNCITRFLARNPAPAGRLLWWCLPIPRF